jgi:hypothetical protein
LACHTLLKTKKGIQSYIIESLHFQSSNIENKITSTTDD